MFKKLNHMEKSMCAILKELNSTTDCHSILNNFTLDSANAFHECCQNNYVNNIDEYTDSNGHYHFSSLGNTHVNQNGLKFIRAMSLAFRIKNGIYDVLKGTFGFFLGILSTIIAEIVVWLITCQ